jgi:hypothetical protein
MSKLDTDRFLDMTIDALDFQFMVGDVKDFLAFSEENIAWQYRRERQALALRSDLKDDAEYRDHLEQGAQHRFEVSLPLRVRYSALISFVISVEWSILYLNRSLKSPIVTRRDGTNGTVQLLRGLSARAGVAAEEIIADYEALVRLRNCVVHAGGVVASYEYKEDLPPAVARIHGTTLENWHFFGPQVCIARGALDGPIGRTAELILLLHKSLREQDQT